MSHPATPSPGTPAESVLSPRYRASTLGMVALISLIAFEALAVTTAMPTVARELDGLKLYALAFGSVLATSIIGMTLAGRWTDARGPGPAMWSGLAAFVVGLLMAGLAHDMLTLLAGRLVQGLGAGCLSPALYVIVGRLYPDTLRPKVFAAFSAGWVVPALIGPALSGAIVEHVGWRWVFLAVPVLAVPAAAMLRGALQQLGPPAAPPAARHGQMRRAVLAAVAACVLFVGGQMPSWRGALLVAPSLVVLLACARRLLPAGTFSAQPGLPALVALRGLVASAFFGAEAFMPLAFTTQHHLSPLWAGLAISGGALGWFSGSWYQGHLATIRRQSLLNRGTALLAAGIPLAASAAWPGTPVPLSTAGWIACGLGIGMVYGTVSALTLAMSAEHEQGANSSALQLCESLMVVTTLAVGGSLFAGLLNVSQIAAFAADFALAAVLGALAHVVARRVRSDS